MLECSQDLFHGPTAAIPAYRNKVNFSAAEVVCCWGCAWMGCFWRGCQQQTTECEWVAKEDGCTSLFQSPREPCEGTPEPWRLEDNVRYGGWCVSLTHPHLVFWRVDTSLLMEESLFFTIQKVIRKKAKLICRKPAGILTTLHVWQSFVLAQPTPNLRGKKLLCFVTVVEKQTKHPVT